MDSKRTRRRLLQLAGVGLATSLAGCNDGLEPQQPGKTPDSTVTPPSGNEETDDGWVAPPEKQGVYFRSDSFGEFPLKYLPEFKGTLDDLTMLNTTHPDSRIINATVEGDTARFEFSAKLRRNLDFTLYIRDANREFQTIEQSLDAPDEMAYKDYTLTFDITDVRLPRGEGGFLELVIDDTHPHEKRRNIFKRHQFVGVEYPNGTRWFNDDIFNHFNYTTENDNLVSKTPEINTGLIASEDNGNQRTVFLVTRVKTNGEVFGVSTTVDKSFVRKYRSASRSWRDQHQNRWECHWATEVSHLRELATKTHAAIDGIGITDDVERLDALGDLIQMAIPYGTPIQQECPPIIVLHEKEGDCSEKSALMAGILANDLWNIRTGLIDCIVSGGAHLTVGVDQRDFDASSRENIYWVDARNSGPRHADLPDTKYAFFEMTADFRLGQAGTISKIKGIFDTGTWECQDHGSDTPPDY